MICSCLHLPSGHNDSVTCTGFSRDGKYVATADMGGLVKVWVPSSGKLVWSFDTGGDVEVKIYIIYMCTDHPFELFGAKKVSPNKITPEEGWDLYILLASQGKGKKVTRGEWRGGKKKEGKGKKQPFRKTFTTFKK